jgi:D-arabinose 5-phosphate isomerase GutQ
MELHCFDLDGTLIQSERFHYQAYMQAFREFGLHEVSFEEYIRCDKVMTDDPNVYARKSELFTERIPCIQFADGMKNFWESVPHPKCIVTHSSRETVDKILKVLPELGQADMIVTRDICARHKPYPEAYIHAIEQFPKCRRVIGYEDTYRGYVALVRSGATAYKIRPIEDPINTVFEKYHEGLESLRVHARESLAIIIPEIQKCRENIYLTGVGKCGYVCQKSASTWQSLGISCHFLDVSDAFHGGFGILRNGDLIVYISNSGKTSELVECSKYIKHHITCVKQICLSMKPASDMHVDTHVQIAENVHEIDSIDMAPTTSSMLFMAMLDLIGVTIAEGNGLSITKFQRNHPGGELGKKSVAK